MSRTGATPRHHPDALGKAERSAADPNVPIGTDMEDFLALTPEEEAKKPELEALLDEMEGLATWKEAEKLLLKFRKEHKFTPKKSLLLNLHRRRNKPSFKLEKLLVTKKVRSLSGVLVVTVLTTPYPEYTDEQGRRQVQRFSCKHNCYYCPNEPAHEGNNFVPQPRSYLHDEPGVLRANQCGFDAATQFRERVTTYVMNGHPIDKIEVLVLGGTWSEYPRPFQKEFVRDLFYAANTATTQFREERLTLEEEIAANVDAEARIIGITLETRPDSIDIEEVERLRSYGCTRLQIGVQHTHDEVLEKINRGHGVAEVKEALRLLKDNCFKVDIHLMPNLPGSTPERDEAMFEEVLSDPDLQADQWKIYPCSVVPWTLIEKWHAEGKYLPYSDSILTELLLKIKPRVHPWIRLNRVVRDIPNQYISGGCAVTNLRQLLQIELARRGTRCHCMRCREIRDGPCEGPIELMVRRYKASGGVEYFISFESYELDRDLPKGAPKGQGGLRLHGFLRLRIPSRGSQCLPELKGCALIRELHVYGKLTKVGQSSSATEAPQHSGLGAKMVAEAERLAVKHGYYRVAVISGVGVRRYYEQHGYQQLQLYQVKELTQERERAQRNRRRLGYASGAVATALLATLLLSVKRRSR
jgi:ELP3 family radical SAM enzyme/protein acetyltransferase